MKETAAKAKSDNIDKAIIKACKAALVEPTAPIRKAMRVKAEEAAQAAMEAALTPKMALTIFIETTRAEAADAEKRMAGLA